MDAPRPELLVNVGSVYQFQTAAVPRLPPTTVKVLLVPSHVLSLAMVNPVGATDAALELRTTMLSVMVQVRAPASVTITLYSAESTFSKVGVTSRSKISSLYQT